MEYNQKTNRTYKKTANLFMMVMIVFAVFLTHPVCAAVTINEIAWMGTTNSANDEWIELYNSGSNSVDVNGWKLTNTDNSIQINLTGTINANGYGVLERTDDSTVPNITALSIYVGALGNSGEFLTLKDSTGSVIDSFDNSSGWVKGDNTTKQTMQKSGSNWITADATPGAVNAGTDTSSQSGTGSGNNSSSTSSSSSSTTDETEKSTPPKDPTYSIKVSMPEIITTGTPITINAVIKVNNSYETMVGKFEYSTGDGQFFTWLQNKPLEYTYRYAGTYIMQIKYYESIFSVAPHAIFRKTITVIPDSISINSLNVGVLELKNNSTDTIDLKGFTVQSKNIPNQKFTFPETLLARGTSVFIRPEQLGFYIAKKSDVVIQNASGIVVHQSTTSSNSTYTQTTPSVNPYDTIPAYADPNYLGESLVTHNEITNTGPLREALSSQIKNLSKQIGMMIISGTSKTVLIIIVLLIVIGLVSYGEWYIYKIEQKNKLDTDNDEPTDTSSHNDHIVL